MRGLLAELGFFASAPMWLAVVLLMGGGVLLAWPAIGRWVRARQAKAMGRRVPTLDDRLRAVDAAAMQRDELERLVAEARETIRIGCAQLDARLERLERLGAGVETGVARAVETNGHLHVRSVHPVAASEAMRETGDPLTREVYALADEGKSAMEIATQLDEHTGKVELMLALRRV